MAMKRPAVQMAILAMLVGLAGACSQSSPKVGSGPVSTTPVQAAGNRTSATDGGEGAVTTTSLPPGSPGQPGSTSVPGPVGSSTTATTPKNGALAALAAPQHPCTLVTKDEAQTILGASIVDPVEAPQGPTCIYRSADSSAFVTMGAETADFEQLKVRITSLNPVNGLGRPAYCGFYGQQTLFVPLSATGLLYITAPCATATKFAAKALPRLKAS